MTSKAFVFTLVIVWWWFWHCCCTGQKQQYDYELFHSNTYTIVDK